MAVLSNFPLIFAPSAKWQKPVKHLHPVRKNCGVQGGCCSDRYVYQLMRGQVYSAIRKIDILNWKTVLVKHRLDVSHGNDLCWNPRTNEIIVAHNSPDGRTVTILDADTLEFKEKRELPLDIYAIAYDRKHDKYYVCEVGGSRFARLSSDFVLEKLFPMNVQGHIRQGMAFHNNRLYMLLYRENVIKVYSTSGKYIETIKLPLAKGEPENIFIYNGTFYITYNKKGYRGGIIYRLEKIKPKK